MHKSGTIQKLLRMREMSHNFICYDIITGRNFYFFALWNWKSFWQKNCDDETHACGLVDNLVKLTIYSMPPQKTSKTLNI